MTEIKTRCTLAIFFKQIKDTLKNKGTLIQFIMFPVFAIIFTQAIAKAQPGLANNYFVILFATVYTGFVPMVTLSSIISEEKEQNTLKVLIMANVKPRQYLLGTGSYVFLLCSLGACVFAVVGGYTGWAFLRFTGVMMCGILASLLLGATVGLLSKNQMSATALVLPIAMTAGFSPMIAMFNTTFEATAKLLYTQQISYMISDLSPANLLPSRFIIIGANMLVFLFLFVFTYKKNNLSGD